MVLDREDYLQDRRVHLAEKPPTAYVGEDQRILVSRRVYDQFCFDKTYGYHPDRRTLLELIRINGKRYCACSVEVLKNTLFRFIPVLRWLPRYDVKECLLSDFISGMTVGIMHVPQGLAYASLAGLPPVYGLYTSFFPSIIYALLGTSSHISIGTESVSSLMTGTVVYLYATASDSPAALANNSSMIANSTVASLTAEDYDYSAGMAAAAADQSGMTPISPVQVATALAFMTGIFQILMGFLHLGFLVHYMSDQLVAGYTTAVALIVLTAQVDKLFGVPTPRHEGPLKLFYIYRDIFKSLPDSKIATLLISIACMIVIYLVKTFINEKYKKKLRVPVPIDLIMIIIVGILSQSLNLHENYGVEIIGAVPQGIPPPQMPDLYWALKLAPDALTMAIITYTMSISMVQLFARRHRYKTDSNQELYAGGAVNVVSSLFGAWTVGTSVPRSCVQESAGSKTQLAGALGSLVVLVVVIWVGPVFYPLPKCVLAAIIIVALKAMFLQLAELVPLWKISKYDFFIFIVSFLATSILDVTFGLAAAVAFSIGTVIMRTQRPPCLLLGKIPNTDLYMSLKRYDKIEEIPGVKIFRFDTALYFANAELFRQTMYDYIQIDFYEMREQIKQEERQRREIRRKKAAERSSYVEQDYHPTGWRGSLTNALKLGEQLKNRVRPVTTTPTIAPQGAQITRKDVNLTVPNGRFVFSPHPEGQTQISTISREASQPVSLKRKLSRIQSLALERNPNLPPHIIIDCSGFNYVDVMGVNMLKQIYKELKEININLLLANCKTPVRQIFEDCDFYQEVPKSNLFLTVEDAVIAALKRADNQPAFNGSSADNVPVIVVEQETKIEFDNELFEEDEDAEQPSRLPANDIALNKLHAQTNGHS